MSLEFKYVSAKIYKDGQKTLQHQPSSWKSRILGPEGKITFEDLFSIA